MPRRYTIRDTRHGPDGGVHHTGDTFPTKTKAREAMHAYADRHYGMTSAIRRSGPDALTVWWDGKCVATVSVEPHE